VLDTNGLQSLELDRYLSASAKNYAVLPDHTSMELYKSQTLAGIYEAVAILSRFPHQVIVLKGTRVACGLVGDPKTMRARLVDNGQTAAFASFCRQVERARLGDERMQRAILDRVTAARSDLNTIALSAPQVTAGRAGIAVTYSEFEKRTIRVGSDMPESLKNKFVKNTLLLASSMLGAHPEVRQIPRFDALPSRYLFRFALCCQLWVLDWIADGSQAAIKAEKTTNDMIDLHIATCATYFDGILSNDEKLTRTYSTTLFLLNQLT
jgi:hypothetical protein